MAEWTAEIVVDEALVRRLVAEQFPEVAVGAARPIAEGWDNAVWLVDETWAFRFPRRRIAVPLIDRELAVLPTLAGLLPVAVPEPVLAGRPTEAFPYPFAGSRFLPGAELSSASLTAEEEAALAESLGRFLRVLHSPEVADTLTRLAELPVDPNSRADMKVRVPRARESLDLVAGLGLWRAPPSVDAVLEEAAALPPAGHEAFVHGDLHFRHLLVDGGRLTGVVDWGDLCLADPSVYLQVFWSTFAGASRAAFLDAYGGASAERLLRARVFALFISATLARYAHEEGHPHVERTALRGLALASTD